MKKPIPFGKYYLLERINVGGMAEVFRAKAYGVEGFERLVAVKRILPQIAEDGEFITMFVDEAKIAVQLNHANIAQIFDLGVVDGSYFIALEHIHGRDLRAIYERCRQRGEPMPVSQACFVVMKICEALDYAHNKRDANGRDMNLVHRDVSPQNVLVSFEGEVKLIDFGIAKAAGKVGKTQAGILKGKFGYMSPEQVRGLPLDRRADVFSTGIVLYEILTGERLFVGETDFSTLEKVRNVEILPPSTYNRQIPEELERIVLKALARDQEDRYQNAIDLHDELQAFVYTAGEFYSRKDLAAWMKKTFTKEIEEETKKLEEFRQLSPPPGELPVAAPRPGRNTAPPPPSGEPMKITQPAKPAAQAAQAAPPSRPQASGQFPRVTPPAGATGKKKERAAERARAKDTDLEWDEEELETQIYDNPPAVELAKGKGRAQPTPAPLPRAPESLISTGPELTVPERGPALGQGAPTMPSRKQQPTGNVPALPLGAPDMSGPAVAARGTPEPAARKNGRSSGAQPVNPGASAARKAAAPAPSGFGRGTFAPEIATRKPSGGPRPIVLVAGALGVVLFAGLIWLLFGGRSQGPEKAVAPPTQPVRVDAESGFDINTEPMGAKIKLDGNPIGNAPLRVRNLLAGKHKLEIEGPAGFNSRVEEVMVEQGKAQSLSYRLEPKGTPEVKFHSEPPGARVTLVAEGTGQKTPVGLTPTQSKLDPKLRYQVVFELEGYTAVTKPVLFTGAETTIAAVLQPAAKPPEPQPKPQPEVRPRPERPAPRDPPPRPRPREGVATPLTPKETGPAVDPTPVRPKETGPAETPREEGMGKLSVGAKPPCLVFIDGRDIGKTTPLRDYELKAGTVSITLVNNEYNIRETFRVAVKPGETAKVIKDFTDRIPQ